MVIPDGTKNTRTFAIPKVIWNSALIIFAFGTILFGILTFDYFQILQQVYRNKYLSTENSQLKEQIQILQLKMNSLLTDIERIQEFEKKLRIMSGAEKQESKESEDQTENQEESVKVLLDDKSIRLSPDFIVLNQLYSQKLFQKDFQNNFQLFPVNFNAQSNRSQDAENLALLDYKISNASTLANNLEKRISEIENELSRKQYFFRYTPSIYPTDGWVTSYYGPRKSHYAKRIKMHEGIDIGAPSGHPINATADGVISYAGKKPGFGNFIKIKHGYGIETIYAHAKNLFVKSGQKIKRGQRIASVGSTGYSTGPHVHYEVRVNAVPVDPLYFILN